jgi:hypothetical protein
VEFLADATFYMLHGGMEDDMAHWLPVMIGAVVAIVLSLSVAFYARPKKPDA